MTASCAVSHDAEGIPTSRPANLQPRHLHRRGNPIHLPMERRILRQPRQPRPRRPHPVPKRPNRHRPNNHQPSRNPLPTGRHPQRPTHQPTARLRRLPHRRRITRSRPPNPQKIPSPLGGGLGRGYHPPSASPKKTSAPSALNPLRALCVLCGKNSPAAIPCPRYAAGRRMPQNRFSPQPSPSPGSGIRSARNPASSSNASQSAIGKSPVICTSRSTRRAPFSVMV